MDEGQILIYAEYFQTMRDYLVHLQSLSLLLITACSYIYLKSQNKRTSIISGLAFIAGVINLIIGLFAFNKVLNIILDLKVNPSNADLMELGSYVWAQFIFGVSTLAALIYCAVGGRYAK